MGQIVSPQKVIISYISTSNISENFFCILDSNRCYYSLYIFMCLINEMVLYLEFTLNISIGECETCFSCICWLFISFVLFYSLVVWSFSCQCVKTHLRIIDFNVSFDVFSTMFSKTIICLMVLLHKIYFSAFVLLSVYSEGYSRPLRLNVILHLLYQTFFQDFVLFLYLCQLTLYFAIKTIRQNGGLRRYQFSLVRLSKSIAAYRLQQTFDSYIVWRSGEGNHIQVAMFPESSSNRYSQCPAKFLLSELVHPSPSYLAVTMSIAHSCNFLLRISLGLGGAPH